MRRSLNHLHLDYGEKANQKSIKHRKIEYSRKQITSKIKKGDYL